MSVVRVDLNHSVIRLNGANAKDVRQTPDRRTGQRSKVSSENECSRQPGGRIDRSIVLPGPRQTAVAAFDVAKQNSSDCISYRQLAEEAVVDAAEDGGVGPIPSASGARPSR